MRKRVALLLTVILLAAGLLAGCGQSAQKVMKKLSGTYIGMNGSVLTLFPDGTTEYYYMASEDIDKGSWNVEDGLLSWSYQDYTISTDVSDPDTQSLYFDSTAGWTREEYKKVSSDTESRDTKSCHQLLIDELGRPQMDNFDEELNKTCTIGTTTLQIPFYWMNAISDDDLITYYAELDASTQDTAVLMVSHYDISLSDVVFEIAAPDFMTEIFASGTQLSEATMVEYNGLKAVKSTGKVSSDSETLNNSVTVINVPDAEQMIMIQLLTSDNTVFRYDSDCEKIFRSISYQKPASGSAGSSGLVSSSEVSPDLKEFLDSYEAFMTEYVSFMQRYEDSDDVSSMLMDYFDMLYRLADFTEKADAYDTDEMSDADAAYYLEVMSRVTMMLLSVE